MHKYNYNDVGLSWKALLREHLLQRRLCVYGVSVVVRSCVGEHLVLGIERLRVGHLRVRVSLVI